jgi:transcriptional regulator with XRE-family HTH domain
MGVYDGAGDPGAGDSGAGDSALSRRVGRLLQAERGKRGLTQRAFARRLGCAQSYVARVEAGRSACSTVAIERMFEGLGLQLRIAVEARDADLDRSMDAAVEGTARGGFDVDMLLDSLDRLVGGFRNGEPLPPDVLYLVEGPLAAMLQGVPMVSDRVDLVFEEERLPVVADWVRAIPGAQRWVERWSDFAPVDPDPRQPGSMRWKTPYCELRIAFVPALPGGFVVREGDRSVPVRPLADVEAADPQVARISRRARARGGGPGGPGGGPGAA